MRVLLFGVLLVFGLSCSHTPEPNSNFKITRFSELKWDWLNPARGNKGPLAATLWGDRSGKAATGFLVKFRDGFSSPPHIHNVSYRGIVIDGAIHNDHPSAKKMWMPQGSYWTQPAGKVHITAAQGKANIIFVEIDTGPYLVRPEASQFQNGESSYNILSSKIPWRSIGGVESVETWRSPSTGLFRRLIKYARPIRLKLKDAKVLVVQGNAMIDGIKLEEGDLVSVEAARGLRFECEHQSCIIYTKSKHEFELSSL